MSILSFKPIKPVDSSKIENSESIINLPDDIAIAEEKIDGCRAFLYNNHFYSRTGLQFTYEPEHILDFFKILRMHNIILDGEIYVPGKTSSTVSGIISATIHRAEEIQTQYGALHYYIFDILRTPDGSSCAEYPYKTRHDMLKYFYNTFIGDKTQSRYIHIAENNIDLGVSKVQMLKDVWGHGGEGVVLKYTESSYAGSKNTPWVKFKKVDEADLFISDFSYSDKTGGISSVILSGMVYDEKFERYLPREVCKCSGFSNQQKDAFLSNPGVFLNRVVKISYMERTEDGKIRHPKFVSWHLDKTPNDCIWEV